MSSPNNANRPVMRYALNENPVLRAALAAAKVRAILAKAARRG